MKSFFLKDSNVLVLIFLNALVIFASGFYLSQETLWFLHSLDAVFTIAFVVEMVVKLKTYGRIDYFNSKWNIADFILVMISIPSLLTLLFNIETEDISFLLALRVFRVFKIFRVFTFIPGVENLIRSIKRGLKASLLILVVFVVFLFAVSILSYHIFGDADVYNNPATALYTTVQLISVEGWYEIPAAVQEDLPEINVFLMRFYFVILLIVGGIFGLSFVNAVLVDSMTMDNNEDLEEKVDKLTWEIIEIKQMLQQQLVQEDKAVKEIEPLDGSTGTSKKKDRLN